MSRTETEDRQPATPVEPAYAFNAPGNPVELYDGPIENVMPGKGSTGQIYLTMSPKADLRWRVQLDGSDESTTFLAGGEKFNLVAGSAEGIALTTKSNLDAVSGVASRIIHDSQKPLERALIHWMNLSNSYGSQALTRQTDGGSAVWWGRFSAEVAGWNLILDVRQDHRRSFEEAEDRAPYLLSHVMEVRRSDGAGFSTDDAEVFVEALRVSFSFAEGRFVAPALCVGYDAEGRTAWQSWRSPICDPYKPIGSPVIGRRYSGAIAEFLRLSVAALLGENGDNTTRFQMILAAQTADLGFTENRIFSAFPAFENLTWSELVLNGVMSTTQAKSLTLSQRLEYLLNAANVSTVVDPNYFPAVTKLCQDQRISVPEALCWLRNRLVHPKSPHDHIYSRAELVGEVWMLSREYLVLLILHSLKYKGDYQRSIPPFGWVGGAERVPWAPAASGA